MTILITSTIKVPPEMEAQIDTFLTNLQAQSDRLPTPPGTTRTIELIED